MHSSSLEGSHPRAARETMSSSGSCTAQRTTRLQLLFLTRRAVEDLRVAVGRVRALAGFRTARSRHRSYLGCVRRFLGSTPLPGKGQGMGRTLRRRGRCALSFARVLTRRR